jgi:hypothetical protein
MLALKSAALQSPKASVKTKPLVDFQKSCMQPRGARLSGLPIYYRRCDAYVAAELGVFKHGIIVSNYADLSLVTEAADRLK